MNNHPNIGMDRTLSTENLIAHKSASYLLSLIHQFVIMTQTPAITILLNIKTFSFNNTCNFMYNHMMTKQRPSKRYSNIFLILGLAFLAIGISADQTAFTWIAIVFVVLSLVLGGRWLRPGR